MDRNKLDFSAAKVLVVGDVMLDRYWFGATSRISPEAPVPVVHIVQDRFQAGGAANVALNIRSLQSNVSIMGFVGQDGEAEILRSELTSKGIGACLVSTPNIRTTTKLRVLSQNQQLIRLDFEDRSFSFDTGAFQKIYSEQLKTVDVVVFSDYAKGCLSNIKELIKEAEIAQKFIIVDPKGQDFEKYRGAHLITPNLHEFERVMGPSRNDEVLIEKGKIMMQSHGIRNLLITRGELGMVLIKEKGDSLFLGASAKEVFDVTGAGDTVVGVIGTALSSGYSLEESVYYANVAAGIVVSKLGASTVSRAELEHALKMGGHVSSKIVDIDMLRQMLKDARVKNEKIVMTNGCFDIIHAGHAGYLNQARQLGDRLVVAVNDDDSIHRLKGDGRPLNQLKQRMEVLASMQAVDWVVSFSEDTPLQLIEDLVPDILVKGGDYVADEIVGAKFVRENGGEVIVLPYKEGHSTTGIIDKIQKMRG